MTQTIATQSTATEQTDADGDVTEAVDQENSASGDVPDPPSPRRTGYLRSVVFVALPIAGMLLALAAAYFDYLSQRAHASSAAAAEAAVAARSAVSTMFTYTPADVEGSLTGARDLLTGEFKDQYTTLITDVAIPGAKQYQVSTKVTVPAVAVAHAEPDHVDVVLFINQTVNMAGQPPSSNAFAAKASLDHVNGHWLVSKFDPT